LAVSGLAAHSRLLAHHSVAGVNNVRGKAGEISGSVARIKFVNPHRSLAVSVENQDGTAANWVESVTMPDGPRGRYLRR
jgi:hypothetical protein